MKPGDKYLSGEIDLGALGKVPIVIFKNDYKKDNQPDYNIYAKGEDKKRIGALWTYVKQEEESIPEEAVL